MDELRMWRLSRMLTQLELAEATGVDASTISLLETGRRAPNVHTLITLADALDCEVRDFFPPGYTAPGAPGGPRGRRAVAV
jgi:transcriptional regulator with XRE-family HTH domain